jgi:hypothetical protein
VRGKTVTIVFPEEKSSGTTKACSTCGRILPIAAFHRRRHETKRGVRAACKDCTSTAKHAAKQRAAAALARGDASIDLQALERERHKQAVRRRTQQAVDGGELKKESCLVCGELDVEAHHRQYDTKDAYLDVEWLCSTHHATTHGTRPWTKQLELKI